MCFSFHSLAEMMGCPKYMVTCKSVFAKVQGVDQLTPLSSTSIEDEAEAGSKSEGVPTLIKHLK